MLILAIDSAGAGCSACLWRDGGVMALAEERMERGQDQRLMPMIVSLMRGAGLEFLQLDRMAVTRGPGSFTGLRIGLAAAQGLGLAADKPVIGIDRFSIYRAQFPANDLLAVIDSRRKELYCRFYPAGAAPHEPATMVRDEIAVFLQTHKNTLVAGDIEGFEAPKENEAVTCAALAAKAARGDPAFLPRPLYIRAPDVTMPASKTVAR